MVDPHSAAHGVHTLPMHFSGTAAVGRKTRRRRTGLILSIVGVFAAGAVFGGLQLAGNLGFDDAAEQFEAQADSTHATLLDVRASTTDLDAVTASATQILESDNGTLAPAASKDVLSAAVDEADEVVADTETVLDTEIPDRTEKPGWFWELFAASDRLSDDRADLADLDDDLADRSPLIETAGSSVSDAGITLLSSAASAAAPFESAHISAKNDAVIALRESAADLAEVTSIDQDAVTSFVALQDAATQVVSSEQVELAEKAGPLMQNRLAIEAFARSLAPGVLLEFDWNPIVNGVGDNGSMGGLTTWWWSTPGHAVIELSNSVAEQWPSITSKSLVAHEVGHAISVKCQDMYDSSTQDSIEKWATAWAISMGYTDDANGVWAYGYPPQSYIDAAAGCR
ncbi:hypothetical protein ACI3KT_12400 [Microbacterium sp. ZW T6_19]|uniref:hypothetical protein n=1 Tax=Microbacterium sp. ZW T6_19 TaxID=3378082 RepID=UPI003853E63E